MADGEAEDEEDVELEEMTLEVTEAALADDNVAVVVGVPKEPDAYEY